jgi:drug/metabolite transporter (DMT)-like permease
MPGLYAAPMQVARIAIGAFLCFLAGIGVFAGVSLLTGEDGDLTETVKLVVGALWLVAAALFAAAALIVFRSPMTPRMLAVLLVVLVLGGVLITVNPYVGPPLTAAAIVIAAVGFAR